MKIPTDAKNTQIIRECLNEMRQHLCSAADLLEEPWKSQFNDLKGLYDKTISGLPATDAVPAALEANQLLQGLFSCMSHGSALMTLMASKINNHKGEMTQAVASAVDGKIAERIASGDLIAKDTLPAVVAKAVTEKTAAGELVDKGTVQQLCSAAKDQGIELGKETIRTEITAKEQTTAAIAKRKTILQTCSLPLPEAALESVLGGTDEAFEAAKQTAEGRIQALCSKGVAITAASKIGAKVWLPKEQWEVFESLALETLSGGDPLVVPPTQRTGEKPPVMMV
ncbi:MAG TPA: hypothetical protein VH413_16315 [Verrucomicrobiae bacterium]|nr:hypothetical protein [Verrucomicrobiae bacterium]